jgi:hypothetical protein
MVDLDEPGDVILLASIAATVLVFVVVAAWLWLRHRRGSAVMQARRQAAVVAGEVQPQAPFELVGTGRADASDIPLRLHVDLHVHALGGHDVEVSFRGCGVQLEYAITVNGVQVAADQVKLPPDATRIGPDVRAVDSVLPSPRTMIRCSVATGPDLQVPPGARVAIRGRVVPLEGNEVHGLTVWLG